MRTFSLQLPPGTPLFHHRLQRWSPFPVGEGFYYCDLFYAAAAEGLLGGLVDFLAAHDDGHCRGAADIGQGQNPAEAFRTRNGLPGGEGRLTGGTRSFWAGKGNGRRLLPHAPGQSAEGGAQAEAFAALAVLGYSRAEAAAAMNGIDTANLAVEDIIKLSLKRLVR